MSLCLFPTSGSPCVWVSGALAHAGKELVDLFQRQRVVQRFQRVDGGHHGAAFEACGRGETWSPQAHQSSVRPGSQKTSRNQLQLFSVDNVIKLKAAANAPASVSYLERTEIYKLGERGAHGERPAWDSACPACAQWSQSASNLCSCHETSADCRILHWLHYWGIPLSVGLSFLVIIKTWACG